MTDASPRVIPFGDSGLLVVLGQRIDPEVNSAVHRLATAVRGLAAADAGFGFPVPGYASLLVPIDPLTLDPGDAAERLAALAADAITATDRGEERSRPAVDIPTRYGGEDGPDLAEVATVAGLRPADVVELHASVVYRVYLLGFAPGFAYLGRVPAEIATPRRATPRTKVAAGSVGIADDQTAVYPFDTPGGWQLIGRTEVRMWDLGRDPPALLAPGDRVRFVPARS